jgi:hypothetical protein
MEPAKVSWEGTQLEVACGKKSCKAVCQIKNADGAGIGWGRETGVWRFHERQLATVYKGSGAIGGAIF